MNCPICKLSVQLFSSSLLRRYPSPANVIPSLASCCFWGLGSSAESRFHSSHSSFDCVGLSIWLYASAVRCEQLVNVIEILSVIVRAELLMVAGNRASLRLLKIMRCDFAYKSIYRLEIQGLYHAALFVNAADDKEITADDDRAKTVENVGQDQKIRITGLVLHRHKNDVLGRARPLADDDRAGDADNVTGLKFECLFG